MNDLDVYVAVWWYALKVLFLGTSFAFMVVIPFVIVIVAVGSCIMYLWEKLVDVWWRLW